MPISFLIQIKHQEVLVQRNGRLEEYFSEYDKAIIVRNVLCGMLNFANFDLVKFIERDGSVNHSNFDFFDNLEILDGVPLCDFYLGIPSKLQSEI